MCVCVGTTEVSAVKNHYALFTQTPRPKTLPAAKLAVKFTVPTAENIKSFSKGNKQQILGGAEPKIAAILWRVNPQQVSFKGVMIHPLTLSGGNKGKLREVIHAFHVMYISTQYKLIKRLHAVTYGLCSWVTVGFAALISED